MDKQVLIFLDREFGSGGHNIAKMIAQNLEIPYYDYNFLAEMFKGEEAHLAEAFGAYDEKPVDFFGSRTVRGHSNSMEDILLEKQFDFIENKARNGDSFVVVGRCAEVILGNYPNFISLFVRARLEARIDRVMHREGKDRDEAIRKIRRIDAMHRRYFNRISKNKWGSSRSYDLVVRSSDMRLEDLAEALMPYIHARIHMFGKYFPGAHLQ
ncbi:MAG: cytidylate kinase-like family protein [Lachnospiraceae bacterium]|nr:cytidylate kinase-like family protein [Lachnospiraceae bacterium]